MSSAVTGSPALLLPITMRPSRSRMSVQIRSQRQDRHDLAAPRRCRNLCSRVKPFSSGPWPIVISRSMRSFVSTTRRHVMRIGIDIQAREAAAFLGR